MSTVTQTIAHKTPSAARLTLMWFGIQLVWGAVLGISLQARCVQLAGASSLALFGLTSTAGAIAAAIVQLAIGPLSDRRRRGGDKRIGFYGIGIAVAACALVAFYVVPSAGAFVAAFIALQLGMNVAIGPYQAILPDTVAPQRIGAASGWMAAMQSAGNAAGAIAATLLGNTPALGAILAVALVSGAIVTIAHLKSVPLQPLAETAPFRVTRPLVDLFVSRALVYVGFYTLLGYFFFYVRAVLPQHGTIDATTASGVGILTFTVVGAIGAAVAARPSDRLDERIVVTLGGGIVAAGTLLLALSANLVAGGLAIAAAGIGWGVFLCADWAYACRLLPSGALATSMAMWNVAVVGPQILAPALTTLLLVRLQTLSTAAGPRDAFILASVEVFAGSLWIWRLPRQARGN